MEAQVLPPQPEARWLVDVVDVHGAKVTYGPMTYSRATEHRLSAVDYVDVLDVEVRPAPRPPPLVHLVRTR